MNKLTARWAKQTPAVKVILTVIGAMMALNLVSTEIRNVGLVPILVVGGAAAWIYKQKKADKSAS